MSKDAKNVPALRFKGYSDAWEKRKLGELVEIQNGYAFESKYFTEAPTKFVVVTPGSVLIGGGFRFGSGHFYDLNGPVPRDFVFKPGDLFLTLTDLTPSARLLGYSAFVPHDDNVYLHNQRLGKIESIGSSLSFIYYLTSTPSFHNAIVRGASGTTVKHSSKAKVLSYQSEIPFLSEQHQISSFLKKFDDLIAATQDKKKNLKYLRESIVLRLLDQDFNLINDSVPWKESRLGELVTFRKGRGYSKNELTFSGTPIILYGRLYTNYQVVIDNITDTFVKEHSDSVKSSGGDVIIPSSGETATDIARASSITRPDIILGGDLIVLNFNTNLINSPFLALSLSSGKRKSYLSRHAQGKSVVHLQNESLASLSLKLPSPDTQARIAEIILQIDKIIVQYDEKVTLLQRLKKMLLQGLFI
ncbi:restriction endonuclease subunit S [Lacticaseibacillus paracasei]|uniref:restriction endonuclease subunit S n=1 Tax=Lacticaseibacillus paracasei TaxID=1597 RepID=UPI0031F48E3F